VKLTQLGKIKVHNGLPRKEVTYLPVLKEQIISLTTKPYRSIPVTVDQRHVFDCNLSQGNILEALGE
jgi:hypothetical protein